MGMSKVARVPCSLCPRHFSTKEELDDHYMFHHELKAGAVTVNDNPPSMTKYIEEHRIDPNMFKPHQEKNELMRKKIKDDIERKEKELSEEGAEN